MVGLPQLYFSWKPVGLCTAAIANHQGCHLRDPPVTTLATMKIHEHPTIFQDFASDRVASEVPL